MSNGVVIRVSLERVPENMLVVRYLVFKINTTVDRSRSSVLHRQLLETWLEREAAGQLGALSWPAPTVSVCLSVFLFVLASGVVVLAQKVYR